MENPIEMDDLGKTHYFWKHTYIVQRTTLFNVCFLFLSRQELFEIVLFCFVRFGIMPRHRELGKGNFTSYSKMYSR